MTVVDPSIQQDPPQAPEDGIVIPGKIEPPADPKPEGDPPTGTRTFTQEDIEKARREEKDKLYPEISGLKEELKAIRAEREKANKAFEEQAKSEEAKRAAAEAEAKKKADEEKSAKELLAEREAEWEGRWRQLEEENTRKDEILAKERRFNELMAYRQRRLEEEAETIMPELRDMVALANSEQEIEASIQDLQNRTQRVLEQMTAGQAAARQAARGSGITQPPVGPLEAQPEFQQLTNTDLKNMDMATYAKNRDRLLGAVSQRVRNQGPYGS